MIRAASSSWGRRIITGKRVAAGTVIASFTAAAYYRPVPDNSTDGNGPDRTSESFCSSHQIFPYLRDETPFLLSIARSLTLGVTTLAIRVLMNTYGSYEIENDENYAKFLEIVLGGDGRSDQKQGLLTVANHRSLFDDPGVISCVLPLWVGLQPKYQRWGICSQEYCFNDAVPSLAKGYIGAGQVLPICRGAGVNQKLLLDFARLLADGEWCHIFPEGGVWQEGQLGGRRTAAQETETSSTSALVVPPAGKLKWGTGKLIAHANVRPRVIPFAHVGMENLLPIDYERNTTTLKKDLFGGEPLRVYIKFGKEIFFDDLIEEHEEEHGKLRTYNSTSGNVDGNVSGQTAVMRGHFHRNWDSTDAEKALYHKITLRIEMQLEKLTEEVVLKRNLYTSNSNIIDDNVESAIDMNDTSVLKAESRTSSNSHHEPRTASLCRKITKELN